jgi:hypothetical protein
VPRNGTAGTGVNSKRVSGSNRVLILLLLIKSFKKIFGLRSAKAKNPRLTGNRGFLKRSWSLLDNSLHDAGARAGAPQGNGSAGVMRTLTGLNCKQSIHSLEALWRIPNNCQARFRNNLVTF